MRNLICIIAFAAALFLGVPACAQQAGPYTYQTLASTNSTLVRGSRTVIKSLLPINTTSVIYYLKFYNKATTPTCGTDTPVWVVPIPFGSGGSGGGVALTIPDGLFFNLGLGFCVTGGIANTDTTPAATGVVVNLGISGY